VVESEEKEKDDAFILHLKDLMKIFVKTCSKIATYSKFHTQMAMP